MLRESKGQMYSWVTHTWNAIKGECPHGCSYCYMKRWGKQKPLRFDESELKTDLGRGNFIFVGSGCDMFADEIPENWIAKTILHCNKFDNTYLFQSKNPERFNYLVWAFNSALFSKKFNICTTIETNRIYPQMGNSPFPEQRSLIGDFIGMDRYVTIEPIMDFDLDEMVRLIKLCHPNQVNIGADSGNNNLPEPSKEKILALIDELQKFTVIDQKRNLARLLK